MSLPILRIPVGSYWDLLLEQEDRPPIVVACGLGVDSVAMLVLLYLLGIRPDLILFADTGNEKVETYAYLPVLNRWLRSVGFPEVIVVRRKPTRSRKSGEVYRTLGENCLENETLPSLAFGRKACSSKWKKEPQNKYVAAWSPAQQAWARGQKVVKLIGYDAGPKDMRRSKIADDAKYTYRYLLREWGWDRDRCVAEIEAMGLPVPSKSACTFCLAGETEVVTRDGIRPIRDLAGTRCRLLVPARGKLGGLQHQGGFQQVEVRSFGVQPLWELQIRKGTRTKKIRVTAEHRWFLMARPRDQWKPIEKFERTTAQLQPGDRLRPVRATPPSREGLMSVAVAQGFTFGDGSRVENDDRPASVTFYNPAKDAVVLPHFGPVRVDTVQANKRPALHVYGLPRTWKRPPPLDESRSFLLSWLAGYFAADGTVSKNGNPSLESASMEAMVVARDVAAVCGIRYGEIKPRMRQGFGDGPTRIYRMSLRRTDLPKWFFLIAEHRTRAERAGEVSCERAWRVINAAPLGVEEEVYCAVVPGAQSFGLVDDLMTGNCPATKPYELEEMIRKNPRIGYEILEIERVARPSLKKVAGLWRKATKTRPGAMTPFVLEVFARMTAEKAAGIRRSDLLRVLREDEEVGECGVIAA